MEMGINKYNAYDVVNMLDKKNLIDIIKILGEEKDGKIIANNIIKQRSIKPIKTSEELASIVNKAKKNFNRYGYVKIDNNDNVQRFGKKEFQSFGYIDGGIICIKNDIFHLNNDKIFSFNEYISKNLGSLKVKVVKFNNVFIDIGTPDDYLEPKTLLN